jgi:DNA-binding transcriptional regulator YbjK
MAANRERALDAAIEVLASGGIRALTHLRVDQEAGLPKGSTSNSFRTRAALLHGVVDHMVERELPRVNEVLAPASVDDFIDRLVAVFAFLTGPNRRMTTARLALFVEASHDPSLREALAQGRARMMAAILPELAALGAPDPRLAAETISACIEGLYLQQLALHSDVPARAAIAVVVRAVLAP